MNFEFYNFYTQNAGFYNGNWKLNRANSGDNIQFNPVISYGLADNVDVQLNIPYIINQNQHHTGRHIGDTVITLGYQLLEQGGSRWLPDLRVTIQESMPSGRFEELNPLNLGTDGTGGGSMQTSFGLNFQHLDYIFVDHALRERLSLSYLYAAPVNVRGSNAYGGVADSHGQIKPGNLVSADLAGELSLNKNWVAVMEGFYFSRNSNRFKGYSGVTKGGLPYMFAQNQVSELSLAPAMEFNFSPNVGLIAGVWFSTLGKYAPDFMSTVVALNMYW